MYTGGLNRALSDDAGAVQHHLARAREVHRELRGPLVLVALQLAEAERIRRVPELLDPILDVIDDVEAARAVGCEPLRDLKFAVPRALATNQRKQGAGRVEFLDATVLGVRDVDGTRRVGGGPNGDAELAWAGAG